MKRKPHRPLPRPRALALALAALLAPPAAWALQPPASFQAGQLDPAVALAYVGPATPEKLAVALGGFRYLLAELPLITPPGSCWHCGSGLGATSTWSHVPATGPDFVLPIWSLPPSLLHAASDADLGPIGAPVILANTRLEILNSFETGRNFIIGHPHYGPDYIPSAYAEFTLVLEDATGPTSARTTPPPQGGPGWIDTTDHTLKITGVVTSHQKLYKEGTGTLWLTGANVWHAVPEVVSGVLMGDSLSLATDILNRGWVSFMQAADGDYANVISGSGGLRKEGAGALTLSSIQRYTGETRIEAGSLRITLGEALSASSSVQIAEGATLDASPSHEPRLGNLSGAGRLLFGDSPLRLSNSQETHFSGRIEGSGTLQVSGTHTLTLVGDNGHQGGTRITRGRLAITRDAALGRPDAPLTIKDDGRLILLADLDTARPWVLGHAAANVDTGAHDLTLRSPLAGHAGRFSKYGDGRLTLTSPATYEGQWELVAGTLALQGAGALAPSSVVELYSSSHFDLGGADGDRTIRTLRGHGKVDLGENALILSGGSGRFAGTISGTGGLTVAGAGSFLELSGSNTYTGVTTILDGTLRARPASLSDRVLNHGRLELYDHGGLHDISAYSGDIAGSGQVVKTDKSVLWLRGRNDYSGGTRVEAGALIGNTDSLPGDIETHAGLAFYQVEDGVYGGRVSGSGTLMSYGPGALTLSGENTHTGGTAFSNTLRIHQDGNLGGPTSGLLIDGGTLVALDDLVLVRHVALGRGGARFDSNGHGIRLDGRIDGPGGVTKLGEGVLHLSGEHGYLGPTRVEQGGMVVNGSFAGDVEVLDGAWFQAAGRIGGDLAIAAGARFSAGNSPGLLEVAGDFIARGEILIEIAGPDLYDRILVGGQANVADAAFRFLLLPGAVSAPAAGLTFLTAAGGITGLDQARYVFGPGLDGYRVALVDNVLHLAPVPEPETWAMLLAGLGLVGLMARRRRT